MEAEIKIGELNICVRCGELKKTYQLDEDDLPICFDCSDKISPVTGLKECSDCSNVELNGWSSHCKSCNMPIVY